MYIQTDTHAYMRTCRYVRRGCMHVGIHHNSCLSAVIRAVRGSQEGSRRLRSLHGASRTYGRKDSHAHMSYLMLAQDFGEQRLVARVLAPALARMHASSPKRSRTHAHACCNHQWMHLSKEHSGRAADCEIVG